jgi:hypothetical protein
VRSGNFAWKEIVCANEKELEEDTAALAGMAHDPAVNLWRYCGGQYNWWYAVSIVCASAEWISLTKGEPSGLAEKKVGRFECLKVV